MAPRKKNIETELKETESKKRASRKTTKKSAENTDTSLHVPAEVDVTEVHEKDVVKTNDVPQVNPGRFTAEMLIAMGKQLEEENAKSVACDPNDVNSTNCEEDCDCIEEEIECIDSVEKETHSYFEVENFEDIAGREFEYRGVNFIALEESDEGILAISSEILERKMRFSDGNDKHSNDWKKSSLRKKLNNEYIGKFDKNDLLPIVSDLTADTGEDDYGKCEDYITIPSDNMFRKFHKIIPAYHGWVWSLTPWAINYGTMSAVGARTNAKTIYSEQVNHELGVVIVCKFKKNAVKI